MDSKLKQRLLGAAVLVALAVIIVPELIRQPEEHPFSAGPTMPGAPHPSDEWVLSLPTLDEVDEVAALDDPAEFTTAPEFTRAVPEDGDRDVAPAEAPAPVAQAEPTEAVAAATPPAAAPAPRAAVPPPAPPAAAPTPRPSPAPPAAAPAMPPIELVSRPGREVPPASPPASPVAASAAGAGWLVQVGSFALEQNANNLRERLRANRFQATVEPITVEGRTLYRVRLGPYDTQAEGERVRDTLRSTMGLDATVVALGR